MSEKEFLAKLASQLKPISEKISIPQLINFSPELSQKRAETLIGQMNSLKLTFGKKFDKVVSAQRTFYRLPNNALLEADNVSGAVKFSKGLEPLEELFDGLKDKKVLTEQILSAAKQFELSKMINTSEKIEFERLWQIKAAAVSKDGKETPPVLCRTVGAFRHFVNDIPVLGPASVSLKLTGKQTVDSFAMRARSTTGKSLGTEKMITPEEGVQRIYKQLVALNGKGKAPVFERTTAQSVQFGYINLSKRKKQDFLIPAVVAVLEVEDTEFPQGYVLIAPATNNSKLVPALTPIAAPKAVLRK